jgi:RNA polymerase sigma-70 factor (ECF subfamily)
MSVPPPSATSDDTPAEQLRWFTDEVRTHESSLRAYLHGSFPAVRDVDDVVQETLLRTWRARLAGAIRYPKSFLFRIARNLAVDTIRRRNSSPFVDCPDLAALSVLEERPSAAEATCTREEIALVAQAIQALSPRVRAVIMLRQIHGLAHREIAARLGLSENSVQKYVVRGLDEMEIFLRRYRGK